MGNYAVISLVQIDAFQPKLHCFHQNVKRSTISRHMAYLWFKYFNLNQTKCISNVINIVLSYPELILVEIDVFEQEMCRFHENVKDKKNHGIQHIFGSNAPI